MFKKNFKMVPISLLGSGFSHAGFMSWTSSIRFMFGSRISALIHRIFCQDVCCAKNVGKLPCCIIGFFEFSQTLKLPVVFEDSFIYFVLFWEIAVLLHEWQIRDMMFLCCSSLSFKNEKLEPVQTPGPIHEHWTEHSIPGAELRLSG